MPEILAIDPGDAHVGVAMFDRQIGDDGEPLPWDDDSSWYCSGVFEMTPEEFTHELATGLMRNEFRVVVYERFLLYDTKKDEQVGSEFETSQLIGVIKFLVRIHNEHAHEHMLAEEGQSATPLLPCEGPGRFCNDPARIPQPVDIYGQLADIKKRTSAILRRKGIKSVAKRDQAGIHCADAEVHGWRWILKTRHG